MRTALPNAARDTVAPKLHKAQDTLTDTVLPAVRDAFEVVLERGGDLLDSDVSHEARRRGVAVVKAAKGEIVVPTTPRRWRYAAGLIAIGTGIGVGISYLIKRLQTPTESYTHTMPVPSGTDGGVTTDSTEGTLTGGGSDGVTTGAGGTTTTGAAPAGTAVDDIDLRSGAPTNV